MLVIAHRGASATFPENTDAAFAGAVAQGADGVELDVRRTADGRWPSATTTPSPTARCVVETAFADLPDELIDLAQALDVCAPLAVVNIEIKNWPDDKDFDPTEQLAADVVALLTARGELDDGRTSSPASTCPPSTACTSWRPAWRTALAARPGRGPGAP